MGSTVYTEFKLFRHNAPIPQVGALYNAHYDKHPVDDTSTVVLLGNRYEANCYPHQPSWSIEYIGGEAAFRDLFLPYMAHLFDDGLNQSGRYKSGQAYTDAMLELLSSPQTLTAQQMIAHGHKHISFERDKIASIVGHEAFSAHPRNAPERAAMAIQTETDLDIFVSASALANVRAREGVPVHVYCQSRVWCHRAEDLYGYHSNLMRQNPHLKFEEPDLNISL